MNTLKKTLSALVVLLFACSSFAASITQIKNGKALITTDGEEIAVGSEYFALNGDGKKVALLKISAVKNGKAIGHITKGNAEVGFTLQAKGASASAASSKSEAPVSDASTPAGKRYRWDRTHLGLSFKYMMDSISAKEKDNTFPPNYATADMKGNNFGVNGFMDFPYQDWLSFRIFGGFEILKVNGKIGIYGCKSSTSLECDVDINYLAIGGLARYTFNSDSMQYWIGAGAQLKQPLTKKSTALKEENIQMANSIVIAGGLDYHLNSKSFIPVSLELYKSLNTSDTVPKIEQMAFQIGWGWNY